MSDNKKYNGYKNIDDDSFITSSTSTNDAIKEQHTLDFYNDDMSRKAVKSMFEINNELSKEPKTEQKKTLGYSATNKNTVANSFEEPQPQHTDKNGNPDYTYQSFDYDKLNSEARQGYRYGGSKKSIDYTNTSFSVEKLEAEKRAREEVEKNKEILKQLENNERPKSNIQYKTVGEVQESYDTIPIKKVKPQVHNKRKQIMVMRIASFVIILVLIVSFVSTIFINISLKAKVTDLEQQVTTLSEENKQVQSLQNEVNMLTDELSKIKSGTATETAPTDTTGTTETTTGSTETTETTTDSSSEEYTVQSGDTLSSISRQFYGDPNRYTEIATANNLTSNDLYAGQKLIIP